MNVRTCVVILSLLKFCSSSEDATFNKQHGGNSEKQLGELCGNRFWKCGECATGLVCVFNVTKTICTNDKSSDCGVCKEKTGLKAKEGEECNPRPKEQTNLKQLEDCEEGLTCLPETFDFEPDYRYNGNCVKNAHLALKAKEGEHCKTSMPAHKYLPDCDEGLFCNSDITAEKLPAPPYLSCGVCSSD